MKKESSGLYILRLALTLLVITAVMAGALAAVNSITKPIIAGITAEKTQKAIEAVLPGGYDKEVERFTDPTGLIQKIYHGPKGYAIEVAPSGFDGPVTMMVGIGTDGKVLAIQIIDHSETPSLGAVAAATSSAGQNFRDQFVGASGSVSVTKDGGDIDAITGATVTSRAICAGVNAALAWFAELEVAQ